MDEIFNKLVKVGLTPNQLYLLWCKKSNIVPTISISIGLELKRLEGDWIDLSNKKLTPKSIALLQEFDTYFKASKKKTSQQILGEDFSSKIDEYLNIFPKFKLPSGKHARSDKKNLENNFRWFFDNHTYTWEVVLQATKMYVDEYERQGYKYMRTSQYFIRKQNPIEKSFESELANYCEVYLSGSSDTYSDNHFSERVV